MKHELSLRVIQQYGVPTHQEKTVTFVDDGQLSTMGAMRCADGLPIAEFAWLADVQCAVRWHPGDAGWCLQRGSDSFNCSVNDVLLAHGEMVMLQACDRIEIGMLRLEVAMSEVASTTAIDTPAEKIAQSPSDTRQAGNIEEAGTPFSLADLTDLADADRWRGQVGPGADPFDVVPAVDLPDIADYAVVGAGKPFVSPTDDLFAGLLKDYVQAIVDPGALHTQHLSSGHAAIAVETPEQPAASFRSADTLIDVAFGRQEIDHILFLSGTEEMATNALNTIHDDILHQFAADIMRTELRTRPPALTRREHHTISPDSHFSLARTGSSDPRQE